MKRAVFLDRDATLTDVVRDEETGVISVAFHPDHVRLLAGVVEGLKVLQSAGFLLAVASNQPGPAKGQFSASAVQATNDRLASVLKAEGIVLSSIKVCMHHPVGGTGGDASLVGPCRCRKPNPGMLEDLLAELGVPKDGAWMIGDSTSDVEAARAAGIGAGLIFDTNRCGLCPLRSGPLTVLGGAPRPREVHGANMLEVARAVVAYG
jgi:D-glycero-D-manno-heptose 1,7-bisphosphate phosphatase